MAAPLLYSTLVPWYRLLDPLEDHGEEAASFQAAFERSIRPRPHSLLELGAGAGHNAYYLKRRFLCTLADISEPMLGLSRELNPECEHITGDMRTMRLGREFDAVLVHDGVVYMTSDEDLQAAARTAFAHTRPGGAALFAPDCVKEAFREKANLYQGDDGWRVLRCVEWSWDPNPDDTTYCVDYAFLLRQGDKMEAVHDHHVVGLFPRATWLRLLFGAGFQVEMVRRPIGNNETDEVFLCRRP